MDELGQFSPNSVGFCVLFASVAEVSRFASLVEFAVQPAKETSSVASLIEPPVSVEVPAPDEFCVVQEADGETAKIVPLVDPSVPVKVPT